MLLTGVLLAVLVLAAGALALARTRVDEDEPEPSGDTRPPADLMILESPDCRAKAAIEYMERCRPSGGEVIVRLDRSFDGQTSLRGTGADAFFSLDGRFLIFHAGGLVVALDYRTRTARHLLPPPGCSFGKVRVDSNCMRIELHDEEGRLAEFEPVLLLPSESRWRPGLGGAVLSG